MDKFKVALQQMKAVRTNHVRLLVISMPKSVRYKRIETIATFEAKDLFGSRMRPRAHVVNFFKPYLAEPHYAFEVEEAVAESGLYSAQQALELSQLLLSGGAR